MRRRELVAAALAAPLLAAAPARAQASAQVRALAEAARMERAAELFYTSTDVAPAAFVDHEREHAAALEGALEAFGGTELAAPRTPGELLVLVPGARLEGSRAEIATAAVAVEEAALGALDALLRATDETGLLMAVSAIMAAAGTHLAVLRPLAATL